MINFPCAKINLGLNITSVRADGYHNLETVFYPIPLYDALEIYAMNEQFPSNVACDIKVSGNALDGDEQKNLVVKAYNILSQDHKLPRIHAHLYKNIPSQAGLGGGSSDASSMIKLLNTQFNLNLSNETMMRYAAKLGADCAFFIDGRPSFATGIGDILTPINTLNLHNYYVVIVKPNVNVSTAEAYKRIIPRKPTMSCADVVMQPIDTWAEELVNDFEQPVFVMHPELALIKTKLYDHGAVYAQMSGSGSAFFGLFKEQPKGIDSAFAGLFTFTSKL